MNIMQNAKIITIEGHILATEREFKGISISDMAASLTLSRAQVLQIEQGGDKVFYSLEHKILAIRKYAAALAVPFDKVVIVTAKENVQNIVATVNPISEDKPPYRLPEHSVQIKKEPATFSHFAIAYNESFQRRIIGSGIILCAIIAIYVIKQEKYSDISKPPSLSVLQQSTSSLSLKDASASHEKTATASVVNNADKAANGIEAKTAATTATSALNHAVETQCQPEKNEAQLPKWAPNYQRKPGSHLYISSSYGGSLCITDATGKTQQIHIRPLAGQTVRGKPPYIVQSDQLAKFDIYLQGLHVKIPEQTEAMQLFIIKDNAEIAAHDN
jgi:transcriptional regulator with XRE-family HTH domain